MKIAFIPNDMDAPGFYRSLSPARMLQTRGGHDVRIPKFWVERRGARRRVHFEVALEPVPLPSADVWAFQQRKERHWAGPGMLGLRSRGVAAVMDIDDNYEEIPTYNPAFAGTHPYRSRRDGTIKNRRERRRLLGKYANASNDFNRNHMNEGLAVCEAASCSTPYLADLYGRWNPNVSVVRNRLDWDMWEDVRPVYERERAKVRVGWLGAFEYRRPDLEVLRRVIPGFMADHPDVQFVTTDRACAQFVGAPKGRFTVVSRYDFWDPDRDKYPVADKTAVLDVGLVPLQSNGFNEAKSHLKGMEYNAVGAPFLASPTESYWNYWCDEGQNGFVCRTDQEWYDRLHDLVADHTLRLEMGTYSRLKARRESIQNHWQEWEDFYARVLGDEYLELARGAVKRGAVQKLSELAAFLRRASVPVPQVVVEVGSARGGTFWAFARIAADDATMVSIDIPAGSPLDVRDGHDVYTGRDRARVGKFAKPHQHVRLIDADSQSPVTVAALKEALAGQLIDVLFIDADHRYKGVKTDFELYSPLVRPGGIVGFHDMIPQNDARSGVHKLWGELRNRFPSEEFVGTDSLGLGRWGGVGLLRV